MQVGTLLPYLLYVIYVALKANQNNFSSAADIYKWLVPNLIATVPSIGFLLTNWFKGGIVKLSQYHSIAALTRLTYYKPKNS